MLVQDTDDIKTLVVPCAKCGYAQSGTIHGRFDVGDPEVQHHSGRLFFLVECPGCNSPFLLYVDWGYVGQDGFATDKPALLYPDPGTHIDPSVPAIVAESFAATIKTAQAGVPMATAMMCRRTLETICLVSFPGFPGHPTRRLSSGLVHGNEDHSKAQEARRRVQA